MMWSKIKEEAKEVLKKEAASIEALIEHLDERFYRAVKLLLECKGKVIVIGVGKSGIIAQKIASTLCCTGTPALFLHPTEGFHGDLGVVTSEDVVLMISNSGETEEVVELLPAIRRRGAKIVAFVGNSSSSLAKKSDVFIDVSTKEEACPLGLVPTCSTTAALAMGDALAIVLLQAKGFKKEDFALLHPKGALGKKLLLRIADIMHTGDEVPMVEENSPMEDTIFEITSKKLGVTAVVDEEGRLVGIITDGDLRRLIERTKNIWGLCAKDVMTRNPKTIAEDELAVYGVKKMEEHSITSLIITDGQRKVKGIVHLHDILKAGIVEQLWSK